MTTDTGFSHLAIDSLVDWLDGGRPLTLIDIRDPQSFALGHIPGSRHLDNAGIGTLLDEAPRDTAMVVVCYHGHSSQQAAGWLASQGYRDVYSLEGGFSGWQQCLPSRVATAD